MPIYSCSEFTNQYQNHDYNNIKKTIPTIWGTYMKLVTKYQISAINSEFRAAVDWHVIN